MTSFTDFKQQVARAALTELPELHQVSILGVGTGRTVNAFLELLQETGHRLDGAVSSSEATTQVLKKLKIPVMELNHVGQLALYIDGADAFTPHKYLVKGGGGALTREKILANASDRFICLVEENKRVDVLGQFPIPIEVIPMARSYVAREVVKLGGSPVYRKGIVTDNGNQILDIHNWEILDPVTLEQTLNNIPGIVENGVFARRTPDTIFCAGSAGVGRF